MALPPSFDPETGTLGRVGNTVRRYTPTPIRTATTSSYTHYHSSGWDRFSDGISSIGEWIQEKGATIIGGIIAGVPAVAGLIYLLIWVIHVFIEEGFFLGVLAIGGAVLAVGAGYYAVCLLFGIAYYVVFLLGYIFYNAYTLILALVIGAGIAIGVSINSNSPKSSYTPQSTTTAPSYTIYHCTAKQLNVRSAPSVNSTVLGSIARGTSVMVYGFEGDFARIKWNGQTAYVSKHYISQ